MNLIDTIDIIINNVYNHPTLPPPPLPPAELKELLILCTQGTPFRFNDRLYVQTDGVSMGSPLGPTFADFYMADLENKLLMQNRASNPVATLFPIRRRYVCCLPSTKPY